MSTLSLQSDPVKARLAAGLEAAAEFIGEIQRRGCPAGPVAIPSRIADALALLEDDDDLDGLRVVATVPAYQPIDFTAARRDDQARAEREAAFTRRVERFRGQGGVK